MNVLSCLSRQSSAAYWRRSVIRTVLAIGLGSTCVLLVTGIPAAVAAAGSENSAADETRQEVEKVEFLGFDLSAHRFQGDWRALSKSGGVLDRELSISEGGSWRCIVVRNEWYLYYSPLKNVFYLRQRAKPRDNQFGPIEGNPVKLLKLEQHLPESINAHLEADVMGSPDGLSVIQSLLRSGHPPLVISGVRALRGVKTLEVYQEPHFTEWVKSAGQLVTDDAAAAKDVEQTLAYLAQQRARIEQLKIEIPDEDYSRGRPATEDELTSEWGPIVDGLRIAIYPWEREVPQFKPGETVSGTLLVRNFSDKPIRLGTLAGMDGVRVAVTDTTTKQPVNVAIGFTTGIAPTERYLLEPGDLVELKRVVLKVTDQNAAQRQIGFGGGSTPTIRTLPNRTYQMHIELQIPAAFSKDGQGRIQLPARGEYHNRLKSATVSFRSAPAE